MYEKPEKNMMVISSSKQNWGLSELDMEYKHLQLRNQTTKHCCNCEGKVILKYDFIDCSTSNGNRQRMFFCLFMAKLAGRGTV